MSTSLQTPRQPDAFEELRRDRGEGWQWHRIQHEPCPQCGDYPASVPPSALGELAVERAGQWREFLTTTDEHQLRHIPEPGVFSPLQYAAHVRDIIRVYTDRMILGLDQDAPTVPIFMPPETAWVEYNQASIDETAADLETQASRLRDVLAGMAPSAWSRIVINDRGVYGVFTFTLVGLACNAVHEVHHHLLDATGTLDQAAAEFAARAPAATGADTAEGRSVSEAPETAEDAEPQDRLAALEARMRRVEDQLAVQRLINSWGPAVDTGDSAAAAALFTDDGILESDLSYLVTPAAIAGMVQAEGHQALVRDGSAHIPASPVITVHGDTATAVGYTRVYRHTPDGYEVWRVSANRWEFRRTPHGWRIARRSTQVIDDTPKARRILSRAFDDQR